MALGTFLRGFSASPAVRATISVPRNEKAAVTKADQKATNCPQRPSTVTPPVENWANGPGSFQSDTRESKARQPL